MILACITAVTDEAALRSWEQGHRETVIQAAVSPGYTADVIASPSVDALRALLAQAPPEVVAAYLFGRVARDTASASSDIDVGVLLGAPPAPTLDGRLLDYEATLERALGRAVQVVILNDASPDLIHRVLRDSRLVLDRDRPARLRFEVRARNLSFDVLPFLTRYRRRAIERAAGAR